MADPFADPDPAKRAEKAAKTIDDWLAAIPEGKAREQARERLAILRDPSRGPGGWRPWDGARNLTPPEAWTDETERGLGTFLGELGCQAANAPLVARDLHRRMDWERLIGKPRPYRSIIATALLAPDCAGAQGLTEEEKAKLKAIADAKP